MEKFALKSENVTGELMEEHDGVIYDGMKDRGAELFEVLCQLTSGSAKLMIREAADRDGFAAWQILARTFGRKTLANSLRKYREVVNPKQTKEASDIVGAVTRWENALKELERTEQEQLPEMIKISALTEICSNDVRDMIYQNVDVTKTYSAMREKVISWVSNRVASGLQSVPMDVGWVDEVDDEIWNVDAVAAGTQCYRCGGKGHMASQCSTPKGKGKGQEKGKCKGKGKGKGPEKGKGKGATGKGYQGTCWHCGKVGHKAAECWEHRSTAAVNEVGEEEEEEEDDDEKRSVDSVWMIANVEARGGAEERAADGHYLDAEEGGWQTPRKVANRWRRVRFDPKVEVKSYARVGTKNYWRDLTEDEPVEISNVEEKRMKITVDSGAGVSVWPASWGCPGEKLAGATKTKLEAANGTPIKTYGEKLVKFEMDGVTGKAGMKFLVSDVQKPLAAVSAIVEAGNEVVFKKGARDSYILNPRTGERARLKKERGTYTMEVTVDDPGFSGQA